MYKVIRRFDDLQDGCHHYDAGDTFPREGLKVSAKRIAELSGDDNKQGCPLIEKVEEPGITEKKPVKASTGKAKAAKK